MSAMCAVLCTILTVLIIIISVWYTSEIDEYNSLKKRSKLIYINYETVIKIIDMLGKDQFSVSSGLIYYKKSIKKDGCPYYYTEEFCLDLSYWEAKKVKKYLSNIDERLKKLKSISDTSSILQDIRYQIAMEQDKTEKEMYKAIKQSHDIAQKLNSPSSFELDVLKSKIDVL